MIFIKNFVKKSCDFACSTFYKFAKITEEMKKILLFVLSGLFCMFNADAASRGEKTITRTKNTPGTTMRTTRSVTSRTPVKTVVAPRATKPISVLLPRSENKTTATRTSVRSATKQNRTVSARAATTTDEKPAATETRTGTEYEQCKTAFCDCMDQFCQLKNDNFRRCSCSERVFDFQDTSENYQTISTKLNEFNENLDVVGMTKEQATAIKTASEGEDALTEDQSASKQLLQAIMNSIKGEDATVGGKHSNLNSINLSADFTNVFNTDDSAQIIASYNGATLYKAVYPKCRNAVKDDCNNASLQRAINAYLMAIEQDCNTVEAALKKQQKTLKAATHESGALLDLARVENRKKHNSDDIATCLTNVETAIQSEEVCGANYHKCLDYGQFIDVNTGAPLTGVTNFYELGNLLTFKTGTELKDQQLSKIQNNKTFVQFFENKTKKFAKNSLDKCTEDADFVWQQYLDRALIDIYYAQQSKVKTIKQSCLDLVASCYDNQNTAVATAIANLTGNTTVLLKPTTISLTTELCNDYIESCNGMFNKNSNDDIIKQYIATKDKNDALNACRAIAQQCFDSFGGSAYNNFYYTQSGLFRPGQAMDWFTLYTHDTASPDNVVILSPCAQQVANTDGCAEVLEEAFGGFDKYIDSSRYTFSYVYSPDNSSDIEVNATDLTRKIRPTGVASEIYYKIIDNLKNHCAGLGGYFVEYKYAKEYGYKTNDFCKIDSDNPSSVFYISPGSSPNTTLVYWYHFISEENMCPSQYAYDVDVQSWGMCSCWENGGYRSKNGTLSTCRPLLPSISGQNDPLCSATMLCSASTTNEALCQSSRSVDNVQHWCNQSVFSTNGQLCPTMHITTDQNAPDKAFCADENNNIIDTVKYNVYKRMITEQY